MLLQLRPVQSRIVLIGHSRGTGKGNFRSLQVETFLEKANEWPDILHPSIRRLDICAGTMSNARE